MGSCFLDRIVALLRLRIHELVYEEIGSIIAEILSAREKAECYEEVTNYFNVSLLYSKNTF